MKLDLALIIPMPPELTKYLKENYKLYILSELEDEARFYKHIAPRIKHLLTVPTVKVDELMLKKFLNLELVVHYGVGVEGIDLHYLKQQGIKLTTCVGTLDDCVADLAMTLLQAISRNIIFTDHYVREGKWINMLSSPRSTRITGKRIGILGLGQIGKQIAKRAEGFRMEIGYHGRTKQILQSYRYFADLKDMAKWCDYLVIAAPGGPETFEMVNTEIIDALGEQGFLINISRGSVVDEKALLTALKQKK